MTKTLIVAISVLVGLLASVLTLAILPESGIASGRTAEAIRDNLSAVSIGTWETRVAGTGTTQMLQAATVAATTSGSGNKSKPRIRPERIAASLDKPEPQASKAKNSFPYGIYVPQF